MAEKRQNEISFTDRQTDTQTAPTLPIVGSKIFFEPTKNWVGDTESKLPKLLINMAKQAIIDSMLCTQFTKDEILQDIYYQRGVRGREMGR